MEPEWRLEKQQWAGHVWEWGNIWFFMPASAGSSLSSETEAWSCCCYPKDVAFLNVVEVDGDRQISHIQSSILLNTWTFPTDILLPWILPWVLTPNSARLHSQNTLYLCGVGRRKSTDIGIRSEFLSCFFSLLMWTWEILLIHKPRIKQLLPERQCL